MNTYLVEFHGKHSTGYYNRILENGAKYEGR
jgi:hypothetical protein